MTTFMVSGFTLRSLTRVAPTGRNKVCCNPFWSAEKTIAWGSYGDTQKFKIFPSLNDFYVSDWLLQEPIRKQNHTWATYVNGPLFLQLVKFNQLAMILNLKNAPSNGRKTSYIKPGLIIYFLATKYWTLDSHWLNKNSKIRFFEILLKSKLCCEIGEYQSGKHHNNSVKWNSVWTYGR